MLDTQNSKESRAVKKGLNVTTKATQFARKNRETILPTRQARLINDLIAVLSFALAIMLLLMFISYAPTDKGWTISSDTVTNHNLLGVVGSYTSDIIFSVFGLSSWWLCIGIFYYGVLKITRNKIGSGSVISVIRLVAFIFLILSSASFEYLIFKQSKTNYLHNGYGGALGKFFIESLSQHVPIMVLTLIVMSLFFISLILVFKLSMPRVTEVIGVVLEHLIAKLYQLFKFILRLFKKKKLNEAELESPYLSQTHTDDSSSSSNIDLIDENSNQYSLNLMVNERDEELTQKSSIRSKANSIESFSRPMPTLKSNSQLPQTHLLNLPSQTFEKISPETIEFISLSIENKLAEFGVEAKITNAQAGPVITLYELLPSRGVRGDKIVSLAKELARGLALTNVRIIEAIPGKNSMGIEVPNFNREVIYLKQIFDSVAFKQSSSKLTLALGKDVAGNVMVADLAKMPHLLVAGTTGSGKSVAINAMILSILFKATPDEVKFIMIDPKMVELSFYHDIPHLLAPVVTDMAQAANALKWTVAEMERRYRIMAKVGCKNIISFNEKIAQSIKDKKPIINPLDPLQEEVLEKWPYIVVIIDELADLMMVTGKKIEQYIARIAQKARAVGIHLIVATQRPSVDVITGLIKANIPARISFQVSSKIDSRTILDQMGAEALLGQGDMLFLQPGSGFPKRIHGAYVNDDELNKVVEFLKSLARPQYIEEILTGESSLIDVPGLEEEGSTRGDNVEKDGMFDEAVKFIYESKRCSISSLQTRFGIGYNRAARIMTHLEQIGLVKRNERGGFELIKDHSLQ